MEERRCTFGQRTPFNQVIFYEQLRCEQKYGERTNVTASNTSKTEQQQKSRRRLCPKHKSSSNGLADRKGGEEISTSRCDLHKNIVLKEQEESQRSQEEAASSR